MIKRQKKREKNGGNSEKMIEHKDEKGIKVKGKQMGFTASFTTL